jgi:uncharacterized protein (DUF427 family)
MRAVVGDLVVAEAPREDLVSIEGNWYFPAESVTPGILEASPTPYTCPWKGACQYWSVRTPEGALLADAAWSYPEPYPTAIERVGTDFSGYVAFWKDVSVVD